MKSLYNEDYFERGEHLGISGYTNYRWLPEMTLPMCRRIIELLNLDKDSCVLDYGCAKGYIVKALVQLGIDAYGVDVSKYAIENADDKVSDRVSLLPNVDVKSHIHDLTTKKITHIVCKDVLEHVEYEKIDEVLSLFSSLADSVFVVVPLGKDGKYNVPEYEQDITHIIREPLTWWQMKLHEVGYTHIDARYRIPGIKDNFSHFEDGNGFFICSK